ncbi:tyrosine-protein phosphatase [Ruania alba]|uniref:Protein tyrosine/serine phosphatase n=1 Tax=Ruania alba TaxID=648782 RepID=A0A1H5G8R2_9MICO|nr:tyrosine-protein phosphatase [Ruania alba]SEE12049.1 Protein tyrosine/serine phosphatase [Ruania alba]
MTLDIIDLPLTAPVNLRDLGGIPIAGGTLRTGFALRADDLSTTDHASATDLVDTGVAAIIDLRSHTEAQFTGRGPFGSLPVTYHHVPFLTSLDDASNQATGADLTDQSQFESLYIRMFETAAPRIVTALGIIATTPGATVFHCAAGQDRTGVLAASLLLALGAEPEAIVEDYARTGPNSPAIMERLAPVMGPVLAQHGISLEDAARAATRQTFTPAPMRGLLAYLRRTYADPIDTLRAAGLSDGLVATLRERALA